MKYAYPVTLVRNDDDSWTAFFDGLSGATDGKTREECLQEAVDLLVSALTFYVDENKPLPKPEPRRGRPLIAVPVLEAMKFILHDEMIAQKLTNKALGERLGVTETVVRRLRNPLHKSKVEIVERALNVLGIYPILETPS
ncbi:hypothetical protein GS535_03640 [Saccharibacter sp. EH611]|uniref:type II toxin-antitoxin system HicB family antitoxin n=1 Tax=unclassified Saccharibacter TaxID=2648722 RepID=UPI00132A428E|nr:MULTISPECIES: type II toxin-antitoxin system HicB family antitoxin [unclassified Saccharibacter]MXV35650.1 hypothetical protein [Saccharibacter sp. EH611]MXV65738.1 hypothetical protein [Saccharibacter sp. EH60]